MYQIKIIFLIQSLLLTTVLSSGLLASACSAEPLIYGYQWLRLQNDKYIDAEIQIFNGIMLFNIVNPT